MPIIHVPRIPAHIIRFRHLGSAKQRFLFFFFLYYAFKDDEVYGVRTKWRRLCTRANKLRCEGPNVPDNFVARARTRVPVTLGVSSAA